MRAFTMLSSVAFVAVTASITSADTGCSCGGCGGKIVTVPTCEVVMQTVRETCYRDEERVETIRVPKTVTVEKQVPYEYTAWVRVSKVDEQTIELKKPMFRWVDQTYTVNVPAKDTVTRTRKRTACDPETGEQVCVEESYECEVDLVVPIEKTRRVKEYFTNTEEKTVKHPYTTLEPRKRTKMVTAMIPKTVYEEQTRVCTVRVPHERERLVPKAVVSSKSCWVPCECGGDSDTP